MKHFVELYQRLDASNKTLDKLAALTAYFRTAEPEDAAWAVYFLCGRKIKRVCTAGELRRAALAASKLPEWLFEECYTAVGDLAETLARILPESSGDVEMSLSQWIEDRLFGFRNLSEKERERSLQAFWRELDQEERLVWNKLLTGGFRVGVAQGLVIRALAETAGLPAHVMAHRLSGEWRPSARFFCDLMNGQSNVFSGQPFPFQLAHSLECAVEALGPASDWIAEWKWDGIRAQILKRMGTCTLWSRGEEMLHDQFAELQSAASLLPVDCVLDGEIVAWRGNRPAPFADLQRRISRKTARKEFIRRFPVVFQAFDLLERGGVDLRSLPLEARRAQLTQLLPSDRDSGLLRCAQTLPMDNWQGVANQRQMARERGVEGIMLKRKAAPYGVGRVRGDWWKWKLDPYSIDAVLVYAQAGHGQRAGLFTDYTFAVWQGDELAPFAKAYSGLDKSEIKEVDEFVRQNSLEKFGPVRAVVPKLVFEISFEGIELSNRHKSGVAVRFPRITRWRKDKSAADADRLETLKSLIPQTVRSDESAPRLLFGDL